MPEKFLWRLQKNTLKTEYEKYRIVQDRLFNSDFDKMFLDVNSDKM